jgi:hypothetical protein
MILRVIFRSSRQSVRTAVAAVELAVCLPLLLLFFAGLLEVGRMVDVQQVSVNCTREACRDASLGQLTLAPLTNTGSLNAANWYTSPSIAYNALMYLQKAQPIGQAFGAFTSTVNGTTSNGKNTVTMTSVGGLKSGMSVSGSGIASGTTISSISGNTVTLSGNASSSGTVALTFAIVTTIKTAAAAGVTTVPAGATGYTVWDVTDNQELFTIWYYDKTNTSVTDPTKASQLDHFQIGIQIPYNVVSISPIASVTGITRLNQTLDWVSMVDAPFQITPTLPAQ